MPSFEWNKISAAVIAAVVTVVAGGYLADIVMPEQVLDTPAVFIEGGVASAGGPARPKGPQPIMEMIAGADLARGEKLAKACAACHDFSQGGPNKVGPNLYGIVGRKVASKDGFNYSDAMASKGGSWDYLTLNKYLWKPKAEVPGTKMNYAGLKKEEDRAALIAWLHTLGSSKGLPTEAEIAAEKAELAPEPVEETPAEEIKTP